MPRFAVYYVPQEDTPFYCLGSQVLGYDIRTRNSVQLSSHLRESLDQFDVAWTATSRPYGFHLTISEAIDCHWATIPLVEQELANLLGCFDLARPFCLQRCNDRPVGIWGETGRQSLVLLYEPDEHLRMLHTLIAARINPLGTGSGFLKRYIEQPDYKLQPHQVQQIRMFYSLTVFGNWYPHFTLLNPYTGQEETLMASRLAQLFAPYEHITMRAVCLLIQPDDEASWQIYREFRW